MMIGKTVVGKIIDAEINSDDQYGIELADRILINWLAYEMVEIGD